MGMWETIAEALTASTGLRFYPQRRSPIGGGCINQAHRLQGEGVDAFVKLNSADQLEMFAAEAEGLKELAAANAIRVPEPITWGKVEGHSFLALEYLELGGRLDPQRLGLQLAELHRRYGEHFGWHRDNTIGATPQVNTPSGDWIQFWRDHRLGYQLELAESNGHRGRLQEQGQALLEALPAFFDGYDPWPSLLHGDLWGGNCDADREGQPVLYDPAVYYGDREADLAMTELFGGFGSRFFDAYHEAYPIDPGYSVRKDLYNLYHVLNHLNLFGGGYGSQAERMATRLLAEVR